MFYTIFFTIRQLETYLLHIQPVYRRLFILHAHAERIMRTACAQAISTLLIIEEHLKQNIKNHNSCRNSNNYPLPLSDLRKFNSKLSIYYPTAVNIDCMACHITGCLRSQIHCSTLHLLRFSHSMHGYTVKAIIKFIRILENPFR